MVLEWCKNNVIPLVIREVPLVSNLIDHYSYIGNKKRTWDNFTETSLFTLLNKIGYKVKQYKHEYDMYVYVDI
jgi:hypothetical protein